MRTNVEPPETERPARSEGTRPERATRAEWAPRAEWTARSRRAQPAEGEPHTAGAVQEPAQVRQGGGRRKAAKTRTKSHSVSIPGVPVVAGVATVLAASAGAMTLDSSTTEAPPAAANSERALPGGISPGANKVTDARDQAADRSNRSERKTPEQTSSPTTSQTTSTSGETEELAAWQKKRAKELAKAEQLAEETDKDEAVFQRVVRWVLPTSDYALTAGFGESSGLWSTTHTGQDFAAPTGTPVRAIADGRVVRAGWDGPYGKQLRVVHDDGTETWYCHLSRYTVSTGERVRGGEVIGAVGSTGNSTGSHLHLEVRPGGGDPIDPMAWMLEHGLAP